MARRSALVLTLVPTLVIALASCAPANVREGGDGGGGGGGGARPTVVSLNPCADAILAEVLEPEQLLAISHYSHDPQGSSMELAQAHRFAITGGTVEEIIALNPDVVVAGAFLPPATRNALAKLGIRVEVLGIAATVEESAAQMRALSDAVGASQRGEALAVRTEQAAEELAGAAGANPLDTILWQPGAIVPGEATLVSDLLRRAGLGGAARTRGFEQADYLGLEPLLANPPQLLLVAGQERGQHHPALASLTDMRTEAFDPALLYCGGPSIIRAAARLKTVRSVMVQRNGARQ